MIVLDSSVLVAVINREKEAEALLLTFATDECAIGAPTLIETRIWCMTNLPGRSSVWFEEFIDHPRRSIVSFSRGMADIASRAFAAFGRRSGHPARLNFGDCMAYAVATIMKAPLLFKGSDFDLTDVLAHPASVRTAH
jgi:ribonuclease VapC